MTLMSEMHPPAFVPGSCSAFTKVVRAFYYYYYYRFGNHCSGKHYAQLSFLTSERFKLEISVLGSCRTSGNIRTKVSGVNKQH